jgi:hypothetical protein
MLSLLSSTDENSFDLDSAATLFGRNQAKLAEEKYSSLQTDTSLTLHSSLHCTAVAISQVLCS